METYVVGVCMYIIYECIYDDVCVFVKYVCTYIDLMVSMYVHILIWWYVQIHHQLIVYYVCVRGVGCVGESTRERERARACAREIQRERAREHARERGRESERERGRERAGERESARARARVQARVRARARERKRLRKRDVLQCVAVCHSKRLKEHHVVRCVAVCCSALQCVAESCGERERARHWDQHRHQTDSALRKTGKQHRKHQRYNIKESFPKLSQKNWENQRILYCEQANKKMRNKKSENEK